jgi:RNA polymerase sigma-B factor
VARSSPATTPRREEDRRLFERLVDTRDSDVREELVVRFLPLARHLARRYGHAGEPLDDLNQVASLGLLKAIDRFDPGRRVAFSSFAVPTILGELKRHLRDTGWAVHVPRSVQELAFRAERAARDLEREHGRTPTSADLAARLGVTVEQLREARDAPRVHRRLSLDQFTVDDGAEAGQPAELVGSADDEYRNVEASVTLDRLMSVLRDHECEILRLRFGEDLTQLEIGKRIGISQVQASRLLSRAIERMAEYASARP